MKNKKKPFGYNSGHTNDDENAYKKFLSADRKIQPIAIIRGNMGYLARGFYHLLKF